LHADEDVPAVESSRESDSMGSRESDSMGGRESDSMGGRESASEGFYDHVYASSKSLTPAPELVPYYFAVALAARGGRCLDVACGNGWIEGLAPDAVGLDFSVEGVKRAKALGASYLVVASSSSLPFREGVFDLAVCLGSMEHFMDKGTAAAELVRVARIQFITAEARLPPMLETLKWWLVKRRKSWVVQPVDKPVTRKELKTLVEGAGATVLFEGTWGHWDLKSAFGFVPRFVATFMQRWLPDHLLQVSYSRRGFEGPAGKRWEFRTGG
jgi:SAM-dependent methyltransferase